MKVKQVATVMIATACITATTQMIPDYLPDGANLHPL